MNRIPFLALLLILSGAIGPAQAQVNAYQYQEQARINAGVRNGSLTPREASRLQEKYNEIARLEARLRSDGRLSMRERVRLQDQLAKLNNEISRFSFNNNNQNCNNNRSAFNWRNHHSRNF